MTDTLLCQLTIIAAASWLCGYDNIITMIRSLLRRTAASSSYARRYMLVGATSTLSSTDYFHTHQIKNRQLSSRVRSNNNNSRAGRTGGRGRGGHIGGRGRESGRGRLDRRHDSGPPTVEKGKMKLWIL